MASADPADPSGTAAPSLTLASLGLRRPALIRKIGNGPGSAAAERRLLDIGFEEGKQVEVLHVGPLGDPLAVRLDDLVVGVARRDAALICVDGV